MFDAGDVIFCEAPLVAGQHAASQAQSLVCARCFRFLGSIEAQLVHRLLIRDEVAGSRSGGPCVEHPHVHSCHSDHARGSDTSREVATAEESSLAPDSGSKPESCRKPDRNASAGGLAHDSLRVISHHSCNGETWSQPALQGGYQEPMGGAYEPGGPLHSHGAYDSCSEDSPPDEMAIQSVQPLLQRLASNTERLPVSQDFPLPSPVKGRSVVSMEGTSGSSGINSSCFIFDGSDARVFCSPDCEKAAWDSSDCVLVGELAVASGSGGGAAASGADGCQPRRSGFRFSRQLRSASD